MKLFASLREKPWLPMEAGQALTQQSVGTSGSNQMAVIYRQQQIALRFFLAVVSVLFSLFIVTFIERSQLADFQPLAGQPWQPLTTSRALWLNSGILLAASLSLQLGLYGARHRRPLLVPALLLIALLFSAQFVMAQLWLWQSLWSQGYSVTVNPANSYFYLLTAVHGLHLLGGVLVLLRVLLRFFWHSRQYRNDTCGHDPWPARVNSIRLCTSYWHYLLIVWLLLFALLTSSAETYQLLASLCGFAG